MQCKKRDLPQFKSGKSSEYAVGINITKTASEFKMPIIFPIKGQHEPVSLSLIEVC